MIAKIIICVTFSGLIWLSLFAMDQTEQSEDEDYMPIKIVVQDDQTPSSPFINYCCKPNKDDEFTTIAQQAGITAETINDPIPVNLLTSCIHLPTGTFITQKKEQKMLPYSLFLQSVISRVFAPVIKTQLFKYQQIKALGLKITLEEVCARDLTLNDRLVKRMKPTLAELNAWKELTKLNSILDTNDEDTVYFFNTWMAMVHNSAAGQKVFDELDNAGELPIFCPVPNLPEITPHPRLPCFTEDENEYLDDLAESEDDSDRES